MTASPRRTRRAHALLAACIGVLTTLRALAEPGQGVRAGSWVFSPCLDVVLTGDSNVYKTRRDETADYFLEPELGLQVSSSSEEREFSLTGNAFYSERSYAAERSQDFNSFGDGLRLLYGGRDAGSVEAIHTFRRITDNDRHASDIESSDLSADMVQDIHTLGAKRDINQLGLSADRALSEKTRLALAYRYTSMTYGKSGYLDLDGQLGQADASLFVTDKTSLFLTGRLGVQTQEGTPGSATLGTLRLGAQTRNSDKLVYKAGAGVERYALPGEEDDPADSLSFDFSADWFVTDKVTLRGGGYNGTQLSSFYADNGLNYISLWTGAGYRWTADTTLSLRAIFRRDDYLDPVPEAGGLINRQDDRAEGHARIDYFMPDRIVKIFLELSYEYVDSNIDTVDYADTRIILGASAHY